jgi:hypothetical protein
MLDMTVTPNTTLLDSRRCIRKELEEYDIRIFIVLTFSNSSQAVPFAQFKLFPLLNCSNGDSFEQCGTTIASRKILRKLLPDGSPDDFASPGYFSTNLSNDIRVELTSTRRTALHRYTFPAISQKPRIVVDVTNDGQVSGINPTWKVDTETGRIIGDFLAMNLAFVWMLMFLAVSGNYAVSFGPGRYDAFACIDFKGDGYDFPGGSPAEYGPYKINYPDLWGTDLIQHYYSEPFLLYLALPSSPYMSSIGWASEHGGLIGLPRNPNPSATTTILARVGVSFISTSQACKNAESEIPDFDFEKVWADSRDAWAALLERVVVDDEGVEPETVDLLYSSVGSPVLLAAMATYLLSEPPVAVQDTSCPSRLCVMSTDPI